MSYLSERQCQFCVDRGVASTALPSWPSDAHRMAPTEDHLALRCKTHLAIRCTAPTAAPTCWCACAIVYIYMLHRWRFHVTNVGTSYVTKPDAILCVQVNGA